MLKVFFYGVTKGLLLLTQSASIIAMVTSPKEMSDKQSQDGNKEGSQKMLWKETSSF